MSQSLLDIQMQNPNFRKRWEAHQKELIEQRQAIEKQKVLDDRLLWEANENMREFNMIVDEAITRLHSIPTDVTYNNNAVAILAVVQPIKNDTIPRMEECVASAAEGFKEAQHDEFCNGFIKLNEAIFTVCSNLIGIGKHKNVCDALNSILSVCQRYGAPEVKIEVEPESPKADIDQATLDKVIRQQRESGLGDDEIVDHLTNTFGISQDFAYILVDL